MKFHKTHIFRYMDLKHQIDVKSIELQTVQRRLEQTDFHHHQEEMKKLRKDIGNNYRHQ